MPEPQREIVLAFARKAARAAQFSGGGKRERLRAFAADLRVLADLPTVSVQALGLLPRPPATETDWRDACAAVAARHRLTLGLRLRLPPCPIQGCTLRVDHAGYCQLSAPKAARS